MGLICSRFRDALSLPDLERRLMCSDEEVLSDSSPSKTAKRPGWDSVMAYMIFELGLETALRLEIFVRTFP